MFESNHYILSKVNQKIEEYEREELDEILQVFYAEMRLLRI